VAPGGWRESRYQGVDDTIVQLFARQTSGVMTRVDGIQSERLQPGICGGSGPVPVSVDAGIGLSGVSVTPAKMMGVSSWPVQPRASVVQQKERSIMERAPSTGFHVAVS
jgi:hypothetical protein